MNVCAQCIKNKDIWTELFQDAEAGECDFDKSHGSRYPIISIDEAAFIFDEVFRSKYGLGSSEFSGLDSRDKPYFEQHGEPLNFCVQGFMECDDKVADVLIENAPDEDPRDGGEPFYDQSYNYEELEHRKAREDAAAEDWLDLVYYTPHPTHSFEMDVRDTRSRMQAMEAEDPFLCRLLFIHQVGALERFLSSTFRRLIDADKSAKRKFVTSTDQLSAKNIKLIEVMRDEHLVENKIANFLHSFSFHHLVKVDNMYLKTFEFSIFPNPETDINIFKNIIDLRHDCVHRNGHNKDTGELNVIFRNDLSSFTEEIERLANHVHDLAHKHLKSLETPSSNETDFKPSETPL